MKLFLIGHDSGYEMGNLCFLFFPGEKVERAAPDAEKTGDFAVTRLRKNKGCVLALCLLSHAGKSAAAHERLGPGASEKDCERALGRVFYRAAKKLTGLRPPWGTLTGIRPARLYRELRETRGDDGARAYLAACDFVSPEKAALLRETAHVEEPLLRLSRPESFSLYISIPFCPSRCAYCSFVSHDIEKARRLVPDYVRLLCAEIAETARTAKALGLRLETVYFGGGTPTSLSEPELRAIMTAVRREFDFSALREYTVEAGRPDTLTPEKLRTILELGAGRISVNPQTMDDAVLRRIGRRHTAQDIRDAYAMAKSAGVPSVNMDLIAGLPGDTPAGFEKTLREIIALGPQAVTVHTLAMKRASDLVQTGEAAYTARGAAAEEMVNTAQLLLHEAGYRPYYLYRQRNTAGNLENTGWSLPGFECLYNIFIMDETHTVLSCGAGGVSKLRQPGGDHIERVFNFKYPYEYIARFGQILDKKKQVNAFYDQHQWKGQNISR